VRIVFPTPKRGHLQLVYTVQSTTGRPRLRESEFLERSVEALALAKVSPAASDEPAGDVERGPTVGTSAWTPSLGATAPPAGGVTFADLECDAPLPSDLVVVDAAGQSIPFLVESRATALREHRRKVAFTSSTAEGKTVLTVPLKGLLGGDLDCGAHRAIALHVRHPGDRYTEGVYVWQGPPHDRGDFSSAIGMTDSFRADLAEEPPLSVLLRHGQPHPAPVSEVSLDLPLQRIFFLSRPGERLTLARSGVADAQRPAVNDEPHRILARLVLANAGARLRIEHARARESGGVVASGPDRQPADDDAARTKRWVSLAFAAGILLCLSPLIAYLVRERLRRS
jgi:hypothetical protein